MTFVLHIIGFHNCQGCSQKVERALRRIRVQLLELDRESGNVTISSAENPEVIRYALERQLKKSVVILSRDLVPPNQNPYNAIVPHQLHANQTLYVKDLGQVALSLAQVLDGVEITSSNKIRINFIHREIPLLVRPEPRGNIGVQIIDAGDAPPRSGLRAATQPSAPPIPMAEQVVYGYPPDFYGVSSSRSHDHPNGRCIIV
ncbi:hypothetical protein L1987_75368 [Smallanthus sonchifolius]|uniref:Uncharacterized protein n=1 Tax=Smallanthus sonchifolius TaxID=185202 RepID=A0ACB9A6A6_9ASTR|nr:hypothetical protein L1987_75368 [Smallanthus sonchifolius]